MTNALDYCVVIPARYESQRLPGKVLLDINGKPLIQRVWERATQSSARQVVIATDDERILKVAESFGAEAILTSVNHSSGSDRIAECAEILGWPESQLIVNLQGDEPLMPAECIQQVAELLDSEGAADAASLYWPITEEDELGDPNIVKVVVSLDGRALLFTRSPVPFPRDFSDFSPAVDQGIEWRRHLGLYAYRFASLNWFSEAASTPLERTEHLEQLRYLEHGRSIAMDKACSAIPAGVDTQEDLDRVRKIISSNL